MKPHNRAFAIFAVSLLTVGATYAARKPDLVARVKAINTEVKAEIGVSLAALPLIADAGAGRYFPVSMLESEGRWAGYKELEAAGYIRIEVANGLPDGSNAGTEFATFLLTREGQKLQFALWASG